MDIGTLEKLLSCSESSNPRKPKCVVWYDTMTGKIYGTGMAKPNNIESDEHARRLLLDWDKEHSCPFPRIARMDPDVMKMKLEGVAVYDQVPEAYESAVNRVLIQISKFRGKKGYDIPKGKPFQLGLFKE